MVDLTMTETTAEEIEEKLERLRSGVDNCCNGSGLDEGNRCLLEDLIRKLLSFIKHSEGIKFCLERNNATGGFTEKLDALANHSLRLKPRKNSSPRSLNMRRRKLLVDRLIFSIQQLSIFLSAVGRDNFIREDFHRHLFLVCNRLFPQCHDGSLVPPCPSTCFSTRKVLSSVRPFLNTSSIPILDLLKESATLCEYNTSENLPKQCIAQSAERLQGYILLGKKDDIQADANKTFPGFCLNMQCFPPLRATPNSEHWIPNLQKNVHSLHMLSSFAFPGASLPYNKSLMPCAIDCITVGFSPSQHRSFRSFVHAVSSMSVASVAMSALIFFFNRKQLAQHCIYRSLIVFNVFSGLALITYPLFAIDKLQKQACRSDGTMLTHQPESAHSVCGIFGVWTYFCGMMAVGYFVVVTISWQRLIKCLYEKNCTKTSTHTSWWERYRFDVISFALVVLPAVGLTMCVTILKGFDGSPLFGSCYLSIERLFFIKYYALEHMITIIIAVAFLLKAIRRLTHIYGIRGTLRWVKGKEPERRETDKESRSSQSVWRTSVSQQKPSPPRSTGLDRIARQLLIYLTLAILSFLGSSFLAVYVYLLQERWSDKIEQHLECRLSSCQPELCPSLPSPSYAVFAAQTLVNFSSVFFMATWTFDTRFLVNVPLLRKLVKPNKTTENNSSPFSPTSVTSRRRFFSSDSQVPATKSRDAENRPTKPPLALVIVNSPIADVNVQKFFEVDLYSVESSEL